MLITSVVKNEVLREQLALRKHCETMLSSLKQEQKKIHKILEELA